MSKKILYIGNKLSGKNKNITTLESLGEKLKDLSYEVKLYSDQNNQLLRLISMLSAVIRHRKYDYVLIDTYSTNAFWFAWSCAKLCQHLGITYITILHGGDLSERLKNHKKQSLHIFKKAKINISPSPYLHEVFKKNGYSNLKIIPNPFEIKKYKFKKRRDIQPKLLWVRAFADIYNPLLALKVLKKLIKTYPQAQLSMVGPFKDNSINKCRAFAKQNTLPVEFTGKMSKENWIAYSQKFDLFINTTNVDNTPLSVMEAMALGLPVVSTNVGGLPYLLENRQNAILVPPRDVEKMYDGICTLLNDSELTTNMCINGRKKVESLEWENVKEKWKEVLQ